jgi:hypothetical protein
MDINYIVDAKTEYTKQLQTLLVPRIYEGVESIYDDAYYNNTMNVLHTFQKLLREIPKWNKDIIDGETNRILEVTRCEWLESLITAVFISNTKILTAIKIKDHDGKIDISIPKVSHFIHRCYVEVAREIYKNPYLLDKKNGTVKERQQNLRESLSIIESCIENAVRSLLPIQSLLKEYLGNLNINNDNQIDDEEEDQEDDDEEDQDEQEEDNMQSNSKYKVNELEEDDKTIEKDTSIRSSEGSCKEFSNINDDIELSDGEDIVVDDIDLSDGESSDEDVSSTIEELSNKHGSNKHQPEQEVKNNNNIKNVQIDNHLLPRSLQKKSESDVELNNIVEDEEESDTEITSINDDTEITSKKLNSSGRDEDTEITSKKLNSSGRDEDTEITSKKLNSSVKVEYDDTRSIDSEFIRTGLRKVKKKKPKLILRKKISREEPQKYESKNRYDFW